MLFKSPHANMQFKIRSGWSEFHPVTGHETRKHPSVWANFGQLGEEMTVQDPLTGEQITFANISGHFFDTDVAADTEKWDDAVKQMVEDVLLMKCREVPMFIRQVERVAVPAVVPWQGYDTMDAEEVVKAAELLRLAPEALQYERENARRDDVIVPLECLVEVLPEDAQLRAKPLTAFAEGDLDPVRAGPEHPMQVQQPPRRTEGGITSV